MCNNVMGAVISMAKKLSGKLLKRNSTDKRFYDNKP